MGAGMRHNYEAHAAMAMPMTNGEGEEDGDGREIKRDALRMAPVRQSP